ncbi:hypothetical protein GOBAR_AA35115 [Gossypium barbadense]|uniref:Uncharacterized protein n=1 Tax=Gossypium barbadense TaxID=3634 RepID=A0A2P5W3C6_GOSBA|nr:hypothetical protein GOBAR_AA35115 [Gossypium barbadense]
MAIYELVDVETNDDSTPLGEKHVAQDLCMVVLIAYVDRRWTANADGDDVYDNNGSFDHEVEDFSDPNQDVVPNDIDDEGADKDGNTYVVKEDNICIISDREKGIIVIIRHTTVPWRFVYCIQHIPTNFHQDYKNADWQRQIVKIVYELEPHLSKQKMNRVEGDMQGETNTPFREWLNTMDPC